MLYWGSRNLKRRLAQGRTESFSSGAIRAALYRPFVKTYVYDSPLFVDGRGSHSDAFPLRDSVNPSICLLAGERQPFSLVASAVAPNLNLYSVDPSKYLPLHNSTDGVCGDNITDWALKQFKDHHKAVTPAKADDEGLSPPLARSAGGGREGVALDLGDQADSTPPQPSPSPAAKGRGPKAGGDGDEDET